MGAELGLYYLVDQCITYLAAGKETQMRDLLDSEFKRLYHGAFGSDVGKHIRNNQAMQYDGVRNALRGVEIGDDCFLRACKATNLFDLITKPQK